MEKKARVTAKAKNRHIDFDEIDQAQHELHRKINSETLQPQELLENVKDVPSSEKKRIELILSAFSNNWSLEKLNKKLSENGCPPLYVRSKWESALSYVMLYQFPYRYEFWKDIQSIVSETEVLSYANDVFEKGKAINFEQLENYVLNYSATTNSVAMVTKTVTQEKKDILRNAIDSNLQTALNGSTAKSWNEFKNSNEYKALIAGLKQYLEANNADLSVVREKAHYYFCKYLYQYLAGLIYDFVDQYSEIIKKSDDNKAALSAYENLKATHPLSSLISVSTDLDRHVHQRPGFISPDNMLVYLREGGIRCKGLQELLKCFYFQIPEMDYHTVFESTFSLYSYLPAFRYLSLKYSQQYSREYSKMSNNTALEKKLIEYKKRVISDAHSICGEKLSYKDACSKVNDYLDQLFGNTQNGKREKFEKYWVNENNNLKQFASSFDKVPQFQGITGLQILYYLYYREARDNTESSIDKKDYSDAIAAGLRGIAEINRNTLLAFILMFHVKTNKNYLGNYLMANLHYTTGEVDKFLDKQALTPERTNDILANCQFESLNSDDTVDRFVNDFLKTDGDEHIKRATILKGYKALSGNSIINRTNVFQSPYKPLAEKFNISNSQPVNRTVENVFQAAFLRKSVLFKPELEKADITDKKRLEFEKKIQQSQLNEALRMADYAESSADPAAKDELLEFVIANNLADVNANDSISEIKSALNKQDLLKKAKVIRNENT